VVRRGCIHLTRTENQEHMNTCTRTYKCTAGQYPQNAACQREGSCMTQVLPNSFLRCPTGSPPTQSSHSILTLSQSVSQCSHSVNQSHLSPTTSSASVLPVSSRVLPGSIEWCCLTCHSFPQHVHVMCLENSWVQQRRCACSVGVTHSHTLIHTET